MHERRTQSPREEIANSISHGIGFVAALAALPVLVMGAMDEGASAIIGAAIFGSAVAILYLTSTVYHALPPRRAKHVFRLLDHAAIYLPIAGTYTPFTLGVLRGPWGWTLFGVVWSLAVLGIVLKSFRGIRHPRLSTAVYMAIGWLIVVAARPLVTLVPAWGLFWLAAGGLAYTAGVGFYAARRLPYAHTAWHLCVMAGTACHFVAVSGYAT
jgi:hemolysin III